MKIEEVSSKCTILKDILSETDKNPFRDEDFWENLVFNVRDNTELENFLRFLFRHLTKGGRVE